MVPDDANTSGKYVGVLGKAHFQLKLRKLYINVSALTVASPVQTENLMLISII